MQESRPFWTGAEIGFMKVEIDKGKDESHQRLFTSISVGTTKEGQFSGSEV